MLRHPYILGDLQRQARGAKSEGVPNKGEQNQKWLPHPYLLGSPKEGGVTRAFSGSLNRGSRRALTGPAQRSWIVQGNPATNVP